VHLGTFSTKQAATDAIQQHHHSQPHEETTPEPQADAKISLAARMGVSAILNRKREKGTQPRKAGCGADDEGELPVGIDVYRHAGIDEPTLRVRYEGKHIGYFRSIHEARTALEEAQAAHPGKLSRQLKLAQRDEHGLYLASHSTGYLGVIKRLDCSHERFVAKFKKKTLGTFDTAIEAARAFAEAVSLYEATA
jgi:hypothetical protein